MPEYRCDRKCAVHSESVCAKNGVVLIPAKNPSALANLKGKCLIPNWLAGRDSTVRLLIQDLLANVYSFGVRWSSSQSIFRSRYVSRRSLWSWGWSRRSRWWVAAMDWRMVERSTCARVIFVASDTITLKILPIIIRNPFVPLAGSPAAKLLPKIGNIKGTIDSQLENRRT